ncbi:hypothetical protein [Scytonema sp. NUACC26]|uniref:hypothetical protein n=1 Tax=Scytonema sp. NUACC26 TaxID=3140176 RepID=UPI0034DC2F71
MPILQKHSDKVYFKFIILLSSTCFSLSLLDVKLAKAQQKVVEPSATNQTSSQKAPRRLRPSFFEESRKLPRFGFGDFLRSALDSEQNALADPAKVSNFRSQAYQLFNSPGNIQGILSVTNRDTDNPNFLNGTNFSDPSTGTNLTFSNFVQGSDPRRGTVTVTGTVNGQPVPFQGRTVEYNAGFSNKSDTAGGVILLTDPNNPSQSIYIQVPVTNINGFNDDNQPVSAPAGLSVGIPTDR